MFNVKLNGLDKIQKKLEEMKSPEFIQKSMVDHICKKVPEANAYKNKFKIKRSSNGKLELKAEGLPPALHEKITKALR